MFVSVPHTNCDENQERATQLTDCLSGMMESVITDSPCPEADGNKLSRNYLWMRGQAERCAWFLSHASLGCQQNRAKPHIGFFLKSHLISLLSSVYLFSNQTKCNSYLPQSLHSSSDVPMMWSAWPDSQYQADLNLKSRQGYSDLKCMSPLGSRDFSARSIESKILWETLFSIPVEPKRYFTDIKAPHDPL